MILKGWYHELQEYIAANFRVNGSDFFPVTEKKTLALQDALNRVFFGYGIPTLFLIKISVVGARERFLTCAVIFKLLAFAFFFRLKVS